MVNFVNYCIEDEVNVEEISGIVYQFNLQFFDEFFKQKGIKLENIVYYKDEIYYFVMIVGKVSLFKRGVLKEVNEWNLFMLLFFGQFISIQISMYFN